MRRPEGSSMRFALPIAALALVTACGEPDYLQTPVDPMPQPAPAMAPAAVPSASAAPTPSGISSSDLNSALYGTTAPVAGAPAAAAVAAPAPVPAGAPAGVYPSVAPLPPDTPNPELIYGHKINTPEAPSDPTVNAGISDEQDFQAVSSRETIESDKARIEANAAQYEQIAPTALPERTDEETAAVIQYVLSATNAKGQSIYGRRTVSEEKYQKACQKFITGVAAQAAFLKAGGPDRDPKRLDPDGDGYACDFDPTPFRAAAGN